MVNGQLIRIKCVVADYFQIDQAELDSKCRQKTLAEARHVAFWVARQVTSEFGKSFSFCEISNAFGRRDHTTVMHGVQIIDKRLKAGNADTARVCADLLRAVNRVEESFRARMMADLVPRFSGFKQVSERTWSACSGPGVVRCVVDIGSPVAIPMGDGCASAE